MKKALRLFVVAIMVVAVVAIAGCSSGGSSSSASAAGSATSASATASSGSANGANASSAASSGSAAASSAAATQGGALANGEYLATFTTDSSMFHVNEANDGKGVLTVSDGGMVIHVTLASTRIVNLYVGTAKEAEADSANIIQPTTDKVTGKDGAEKEAYGFDIPVPAIGEEFDVAILGEKGNWYDHKVSVSDPIAK